MMDHDENDDEDDEDGGNDYHLGRLRKLREEEGLTLPVFREVETLGKYHI